MTEPYSLHELIRHADGKQDLYKPAHGMYGPGLCRAHAMQYDREHTNTEKAIHELAAHPGRTPVDNGPNLQWNRVGQGSCGDCTRFNTERTKQLPGSPTNRTPGMGPSPERAPRREPERRVPFMPLRQSLNSLPMMDATDDEQDEDWAADIAPQITTTGRQTPHQRVFGPTDGLDHRLWENGKLKPDVRRYVLDSINEMWAGKYKNWSSWSKVYFAGSEASEWTGPNLEGNGDFDVLVGVHYVKFRKANPEYKRKSNLYISGEMNLGFRKFNGSTMIRIDGKPIGPFDRTTYVNPDSYDIRRIRPYAAYDVGADEWAVKPPHLPNWGIDKMPPEVLRALRGAEAYARDVLKLPEPQKTQQGAALFQAWHSDRSRAFGPQGEGWYDFANLREKWLDQQGVWSQLVNCAHRAKEGGTDSPSDWSNDPRFATLMANRISTVSPELFGQHFLRALHNNPYALHLTHHTPESIHEQGMTPLLAHGGHAGVLVHDHGDGRVEATGLFNRSGVKGGGLDLLRHAIQHHGVNYAEAYGPHLPKMYESLGFKTTEQHPFDKSLAHPDWDYKRFGEPDYHMMHLQNDQRREAAMKRGDLDQVDWTDPTAVAALRERIEAELLAEHGPVWFAEHQLTADANWEAALAQLGI